MVLVDVVAVDGATLPDVETLLEVLELSRLEDWYLKAGVVVI